MAEQSHLVWRVDDWGHPDYLDGAQMQFAVMGPDSDWDTRAYVGRADDARIFSAAHDMLEACQNALAAGLPSEVAASVRAAIAKASGGSNEGRD